MKVSIYVACHKKISRPIRGHSFLKYIEVGRSLHNKRIYRLNDANGDSISTKNKSYNELTALYWAWKNDNKSDILGFCHYRRYFASFKTSNRHFYKKLLKPIDIEDILFSYDFIAIKIGPFNISCRERIGTSQSALRTKDIDVIKQIIDEKYGNVYSAAFDKVLNRNWNYLLNMFIAKRTIVDNYCSWLFPILEELEKRINPNELVDAEKRIFGLWGEYLFSVFAEANCYKIYSAHFFQYEPVSFCRKIVRKIAKTLGVKK